ncbi:MAG: CpaF family protein [Coriobacteriales bacterium]|jgi:pilus assembly protein CpaF|nr:CpaF family protein [Coriobacteriales bacterium]
MSLRQLIAESQQDATLTQEQVGRQRQQVLKLREQLFTRIAPAKIVDYIERNPARAQQEVKAVLEQELDCGRGSGPASEAERQLMREVMDLVLGFGPLQGLLSDPEVTEIMVNGPSRIFYEQGGLLYRSQAVFYDEQQLSMVVERILGPLGRRVDEQSPVVSARLPQGHRVNVVIAPISLEGTILTIRKFRERIYSLAELTELGSLDQSMQESLRQAVRTRKNIAVSGGTGAGKTTLLNALSLEIPAGERIVTIEDAAELKFEQHPHVVRLEARPASAEGTGQVSIRDLVVNALRMRPDRIVVGECRGAEALDMLQAMNTGHDGSLTTLHANSPAEVAARLTMMSRYAMDIPVSLIEQQIASALDLIVQIRRLPDGRRQVSQLASLAYHDGRLEVRPWCT